MKVRLVAPAGLTAKTPRKHQDAKNGIVGTPKNNGSLGALARLGALAVILLGGCLAGTPATRTSHIEVESAAQTASNAIAWARAAAAHRHVVIEFRVRPEERRFVSAEETAPGVFSLIPESERALADDVAIASIEGMSRGISEGESVVRFTPRGAAPALAIKLAHKGGAWRTVHLETDGRLWVEEPPLE